MDIRQDLEKEIHPNHMLHLEDLSLDNVLRRAAIHQRLWANPTRSIRQAFDSNPISDYYLHLNILEAVAARYVC